MDMARASTPYTRLRRDLKESRVALVSTSGAYAMGMEPFSENDPTFRIIPDATESRAIRFVAGHFDTSKAAIDPNILFPLDRLHDLVGWGEIGQAAEHHVTMGLTTELRKLREQTSWEIAKSVLQARPDVVVLTGG